MNDLNQAVEINVKYPDPPMNQAAEYDLGEVKETPKVEPKPEPKVEARTEPVPADEGIDVLRRQLEEKRREAEEAKRQRLEAERLAQEREQQLMSVKTEAQSSQHTALVNAIASFERDAEMLETKYASLLENGDYREAAKVQRQMAQVESKLTTLQQGREELEYRLQNPPQPQIKQVPRDSIDDKISHLTQRSQDWIRSHPEVLSDPKLNNLMTAGHYEAVANGYAVDTPEYFSHIENKLGYGRQVEPEVQKQVEPVQNQAQGRVPVASAPVSRSAPASISRTGNSMTVTLTPEMRATAAELGMSEEEYAENLAFYINRGDIRTR